MLGTALLHLSYRLALLECVLVVLSCLTLDVYENLVVVVVNEVDLELFHNFKVFVIIQNDVF